jgi:hypothetical protein
MSAKSMSLILVLLALLLFQVALLTNVAKVLASPRVGWIHLAFKKHIANVKRNGNIPPHPFLETQVSVVFNPWNNP